MGLLVGDVFRRAAAATPRRVAVSMEERALTFGEVHDASSRVGAQLRELGVRRGDRVAWIGNTSVEVVPLFAALADVGAAFVPLNSRLGVDECAAVLARARASLLVASGGLTDLAEGVSEAAGGPPVARLAADGRIVGEVHAAGRDWGEPAGQGFGGVSEDDPHVVFFTSGSTGVPKGVVISHRADCLRSYPPNGPVARGGTVCMFPFFHMASWTIALGCWQVREELVLVERADAERVLHAVQARRAGRVYLIPAVWDRVLAELRRGAGRWDTSSLNEADTGTSATPPELLEAIRSAFPSARTRVMYGSTEAGAAASLAPEDISRKPGSVGLPAYGSEVMLTDDGEVCVRNGYLMDGYFDDPTSTAEALRGGWYHTGDLGELDDEGYLYIVGRARDVIRTGGETVAPEEVESVVRAVAGVADVAVVGIPDPTWGEVVCAVVVPGQDEAPELQDLRGACDGRLAPFKQPRRLEIVDSLPRTDATGQVQRRLIVERLGLRSR